MPAIAVELQPIATSSRTVDNARGAFATSRTLHRAQPFSVIAAHVEAWNMLPTWGQDKPAAEFFIYSGAHDSNRATLTLSKDVRGQHNNRARVLARGDSPASSFETVTFRLLIENGEIELRRGSYAVSAPITDIAAITREIDRALIVFFGKCAGGNYVLEKKIASARASLARKFLHVKLDDDQPGANPSLEVA